MTDKNYIYVAPAWVLGMGLSPCPEFREEVIRHIPSETLDDRLPAWRSSDFEHILLPYSIGTRAANSLFWELISGLRKEAAARGESPNFEEINPEDWMIR